MQGQYMASSSSSSSSTPFTTKFQTMTGQDGTSPPSIPAPSAPAVFISISSVSYRSGPNFQKLPVEPFVDDVYPKVLRCFWGWRKETTGNETQEFQ